MEVNGKSSNNIYHQIDKQRNNKTTKQQNNNHASYITTDYFHRHALHVVICTEHGT